MTRHYPYLLAVLLLCAVCASALTGCRSNYYGNLNMPLANMSGPTKTIKAIYFDVGDVLAKGILAPKKADLAKQYGLDPAQLDAVSADERKLADLGKISDCQFWVMTLQQVGVNPHAPQDCDIAPYIQPVPGTIDILTTLARDMHYSVGILTNDSAEMADQRATVLGYRPYITDKMFIVSSAVGIKKPDTAIYKLAISRTGLSPSQVLFIDEDQTNLDAAAAAGMATIKFTDANQLPQDLATYGINLPITAVTAAKKLLIPASTQD